MMRSYGQSCLLAKALDLVGDRWTLLIVRELLIRPACRYTDLRDGLPGIPSNLLVKRLQQMEQADLISRAAAPPPIATTLFRLTARGRELGPVVEALARWAVPFLEHPNPADAFCDHWTLLPLRLHLRDRTPDAPPVRVAIRAGTESIVLTAGGSIQLELGTAADADARIEGDPREVIGLLTGRMTLRHAQSAGLTYEGDPSLLERFVGVPTASG